MSIEQKQREFEDVHAIRFVAGTLLEVSAERIKKLRDQFEKNQLFYAEISDLYGVVKWNAERRQELDAAVPTKNKRSVSIAITSNSRFYGSLNRQMIQAFIKHMASDASRSYMVLGAVGERLMQATEYYKKSVYLSFAGDQPTQNEIRHLLDELDSYAEVQIFHPQFVNVFQQDVAVLDMNQSAPKAKHSENVDYLFEPELPRILKFFETRVRYLLFQRAMLESELARTAARLTSMSRSEERAAGVLKKIRTEIRREQQTLDSQRLLESLAGSLKWRIASHNL